MNCIEARRMVTPFVNKELSDRETEQFLKHIEHCDDCRDELDIYFTMYKAIDMLDSGGQHEFDFKKMLENDIRASHRAIVTRKVTRLIRCMIILAAELILLFCVYTGYEMRQGELERSTFQMVIERLQSFSFTEEEYANDYGHQEMDVEPDIQKNWTDKSDIVSMDELMDKKLDDKDKKTETKRESETDRKEEETAS